MAFCTNCGNSMPDESRFCPACGHQAGAAPGLGTAPMGTASGMRTAPGPASGSGASPQPGYGYAPPAGSILDYEIQGDNLQVARVRMRAGQEIYAEAGKMLYKTPSIGWETRMQGDSLGQKIWGAVKRKLMGESLFMTYFRANSDGEVGFAGSYPGRIQPFTLAAGQSVLVQRDSFLFAQTTVQLNVALVKRLGVGFFGGEGFILEKLTGPGSVFIHGGGDFIEFTLRPGEVLQVDT
ncbi:MAG TPA: AIM24 family protein, partial [Bryobacteraceae bacterium]|nr:AIM24 family protein [Bryobacteraceae bacterium]